MFGVRVVACGIAIAAISGPLQAFQCKFDSTSSQHACLIELSTVQVLFSVDRAKLDDGRIVDFEAKGSGFVLDGSRNLVVTAKHVLLGTRAWKPDIDDSQWKNLIDPYSAIEGFIRQYGTLQVRTGKGLLPIDAELVALDSMSDVAILRFGGKDAAIDTRINGPFQTVRFAQGCEKGMFIIAAGYPNSMKDDFGRSQWGQVDDCRLSPILYDEGFPWTSALLYRANAIFEAGMSGGPVIRQDGKLIGIVAGATANGVRSFIVPEIAIRRFIGRLGIDVDVDR